MRDRKVMAGLDALILGKRRACLQGT